MWHLIAHVSEVANHGDFVVIGGIAVTNFHGKVIAWDGRCSHRGTALYGDDWYGNNADLKCAYHGRCQQAKNLRVVHGIRITNDWIFANDWAVSGDSNELVAPMPMQMPPMKLHSRLRFLYLCPWDVAVENALDFDHVRTIHKSSLHRMQLASVSLELHDQGSSTEYFESGHWERLDKLGAVLPAVFDEDCGYDYVHMHFAPDSCLSSTRGWTWSLQNYSYVSPNVTMFTHRLYAAEGCNVLADEAERLNGKIFTEDADVVKFVAARYGELEPSEKRIAHFRRFA